MDKEPSDPSESPPRSLVKKEKDEEIKEFAETAMNELLGWYGYERLELRRWAASRARDASSPDNQNESKDKDECTWCNKSISSESGAFQQSGATFCSELCFSQSRRANFKRAKTCDWCKHVRHTVAYVDFQDGATQLQFCSEKCLNQYKMHIFCRETQAHLDLNPHLVSSSSTSNLITPELWLKNCRSRSASPTSETSRSPTLEIVLDQKPKPEKELKADKKSPTPLITVAPSSKLMKPKNDDKRKSPETKRDLRSKGNLRKRRVSKCTSTVTSQTNTRPTTTTPKAQDLRMCSPSTHSSPTSTIGNNLHSPPNPIPHLPLHPPQFPNPLFSNIQPPMFMDNPLSDHRIPMFPPQFMPRPNMSFPQERPRLNIPQINIPQVGLGQPPPVTVLVPYPVVLPIPVPIPIPLPFSAFIEANSNKYKPESRADDGEGPLDFTMNGNKNRTVPECTQNEVEDDSEKYDEEYNLNNDKDNDSIVNNPEQSLPKFKITRVGNKMAKIVTKRDSDSTRPLRKRRRLVEPSNDEDSIISKRKIVQV